MKNIKIFPKDWLQLHPYKQSTPVDSYYTGIANRIYDIMEKTELVNSFEGEETKQICIRMAAYFEDVISGMGIWRAFILTHKELYGKYLPFYTPDDHYYDDEVNLEDVRFLLWHYTQQYHGYRKGTFVSPDNPANESTGMLIYDLFCKEWTTAPENTRMAKLFALDTRYERQEDYDRLLQWFHYESYILPESARELSDFAHDRWKEQPDLNQEQLNNLLVNSHGMMAYTSKTSLLGLTSPQWLAKILPAEHPDPAVFQNTACPTICWRKTANNTRLSAKPQVTNCFSISTRPKTHKHLSRRLPALSPPRTSIFPRTGKARNWRSTPRPRKAPKSSPVTWS